MTDDIELPPRLSGSPNARLIRLHYDQLGVFRWSADRFLRLCAAWRETPEEMGARIGLDRREVKRRLERGRFTAAECILLAQHERFIRALNGQPQRGELFPPAK